MPDLILTPELAQQIVSLARQIDEAKVLDTAVRKDQAFVAVKLYLDSAPSGQITPLNASTAIQAFGRFRSFAVTDQSDSTVKAFLIVNERQDNNGQNRIALVPGVSHDFGEFQNSAFWYMSAAQPGRWIEVTFFLKGLYKNNTVNLNNSGGNSLIDGSAIVTDAAQNATGTAAILIPAGLNRKSAVLENQGSSPIYLGSSIVTVPGGANPGQTLLPSGQCRWNNTAALYGITGGATVAVAVNEEN